MIGCQVVFLSIIYYHICMKKFLLILPVLFYFLFNTSSVEAKALPRSKTAVSRSAPVASGIGVSAKLKRNPNTLIVYFSNLNKASNVQYMLSYQSEGVEQGVGGSLSLGGENSAQRELLFGTCSSGVCRYHTGITNARLEVTITTTAGKTSIKRFRIRV